MKVSIIIPVYNGEKYVKESLDSLINQTYKDIEIIVIDDGSTDKTADILKTYTKIKYVYQNNSGQSSALNKGWSIATGEILGYLSCDDVLYSNCIEVCLKALKDNQVVVAYPNYELINQHGEFIKKIDLGDFEIRKQNEELICFPGPGALFRRKEFIKLGGWNTELTQVPDFDFWIRISEFGKFKRINDSLAKFRIHKESGSVKSISITKSNEIIDVVKCNFKKNENTNYKRALSNSYIIAAYHHSKSRRYIETLTKVSQANFIYPSKEIFYKSVRLLFSTIKNSFYK